METSNNVVSEVRGYARAPWGSQKWYAYFLDIVTGEEWMCGHSHSTEPLAAKCAEKRN